MGKRGLTAVKGTSAHHGRRIMKPIKANLNRSRSLSYGPKQPQRASRRSIGNENIGEKLIPRGAAGDFPSHRGRRTQQKSKRVKMNGFSHHKAGPVAANSRSRVNKKSIAKLGLLPSPNCRRELGEKKKRHVRKAGKNLQGISSNEISKGSTMGLAVLWGKRVKKKEVSREMAIHQDSPHPALVPMPSSKKRIRRKGGTARLPGFPAQVA